MKLSPIPEKQIELASRAGAQLRYAGSSPTMECLAGLIGVSKVTLYRHFSTSEALVCAAIRSRGHHLLMKARSLFAGTGSEIDLQACGEAISGLWDDQDFVALRRLFYSDRPTIEKASKSAQEQIFEALVEKLMNREPNKKFKIHGSRLTYLQATQFITLCIDCLPMKSKRLDGDGTCSRITRVNAAVKFLRSQLSQNH